LARDRQSRRKISLAEYVESLPSGEVVERRERFAAVRELRSLEEFHKVELSPHQAKIWKRLLAEALRWDDPTRRRLRDPEVFSAHVKEHCYAVRSG
jgi:hypothetical protein